jgi:hypothetical protein
MVFYHQLEKDSLSLLPALGFLYVGQHSNGIYMMSVYQGHGLIIYINGYTKSAFIYKEKNNKGKWHRTKAFRFLKECTVEDVAFTVIELSKKYV